MLDFVGLLAPGETVDDVVSDDVLVSILGAGLVVEGDEIGTILACWRRLVLSAPYNDMEDGNDYLCAAG